MAEVKENKTEYVMILKEDLMYDGLQLKKGLNKTKDKFWVYTLDTVRHFINQGTLIAEVDVVDGVDSMHSLSRIISVPVVITKTITIKNITPVKDHPMWYDEEFCMKAVQARGDSLQYVKNQTPGLCVLALTSGSLGGNAFPYVKKPNSGNDWICCRY
jgi:hypothetical protein